MSHINIECPWCEKHIYVRKDSIKKPPDSIDYVICKCNKTIYFKTGWSIDFIDTFAKANYKTVNCCANCEYSAIEPKTLQTIEEHEVLSCTILYDDLNEEPNDPYTVSHYGIYDLYRKAI